MEKMKKMTSDELRGSWPRLLGHISETLKLDCKDATMHQTKVQAECFSVIAFQLIEISAQLSELNENLNRKDNE
jgi:hypothetical protein